ncbi:MAG: hypothetical protein GXO71_04005 [Caldiserica bacterium]|nr:hypothetical protein [Caldisericota bacterium]
MTPLSKTYRRAITSYLSLVEELVDEIRNILLKSGRGDGIFMQVRKVLSPEDTQEIQRLLEKIEDRLRILKKDLHLYPEVSLDASLISSRSAKVWEILCDLEVDRLKRYGPPPSDLAEYLDPKIKELISLIEEITTITQPEEDS